MNTGSSQFTGSDTPTLKSRVVVRMNTKKAASYVQGPIYIIYIRIVRGIYDILHSLAWFERFKKS